jgi:hypothetical protein
MKIPLVGAEFFYADEQTEMTGLIVAFPNFVKAPKKSIDKLAFSDITALKVIQSVVLQSQQTIKLTIVSVEHNLYLSGIKPSYLYMFRFWTSHHQAESLKKDI